MNRIIVSFFALLAAAPLAAQEQTPRVLSLDEALEITLSGSPVIEASRYEEKPPSRNGGQRSACVCRKSA